MRSFARDALKHMRPGHVRDDIVLPRRQQYHPSPVDWRDEVLYFLLVDRFSNGNETPEMLLDRDNLAHARPQGPGGEPWRWDRWAQSGNDHFQGGTLAGVKSKLGYLKKLGVTAIWISPVFKQRGHIDSYHGYGVQDFLDVDPRFGTRKDLVSLVDKAHERGMRVLLDIIFNHSGSNWDYPADPPDKPPYLSFPGRYSPGLWKDADGRTAPGMSLQSAGTDDAVWPAELMDPECYTRAGHGSLDDNEINNPVAEHKRTDFEDLRDFNLPAAGTLNTLASCYKYWIALTDCDGFRIDTLKHVSMEEARNFCGTIKEFAANVGKCNFFLVGEVAGGDVLQSKYLDALERNMNAVLDIGDMRLVLNAAAKGLIPGLDFFGGFHADRSMGSHRNLGNRHVTILDDHDHVNGRKVRFSADVPEASRDRQIVAGTALQLLSLGIPCIYYGTEQAFAGPELSEREWLPEYGGSDRYLREAMFGPAHPRKRGRRGLLPGEAGIDTGMPGFGPFGTCGHHCFDVRYPAYVRIAALAAIRKAYPALRHGRQYYRPIRAPGSTGPFAYGDAGSIVAWSRILDDEEILCVLNAHGTETRGAGILVDYDLNGKTSAMDVILNTAEVSDPGGYDGEAPRVDATVGISPSEYGSFIELNAIGPSCVIVLTNHVRADEGWVVAE
jgi:glycosidase